MSSNEKVVDVLKSIAESSNDGLKAYQECVESCDAPELKSLFARSIERCRNHISDLEQMIKQYNGEVESKGSLLGSLHLGWLNLRTALSSNNDKIVLEECERSEDAAIQCYRDALENELPSDVKDLLRKQFQDVKAHHELIRILRDAQA